MEDDPEQLAYEFIYAIKTKDLESINILIEMNKDIKCFVKKDLKKIQGIKTFTELKEEVDKIYLDIKNLLPSEYKKFCIKVLDGIISDDVREQTIFQLIENNNLQGLIDLINKNPNIIEQIHPLLGDNVLMYSIKLKRDDIIKYILNLKNITYKYLQTGEDYIKNKYWNNSEMKNYFNKILLYKSINRNKFSRTTFGSKDASKRKGSILQSENNKIYGFDDIDDFPEEED